MSSTYPSIRYNAESSIIEFEASPTKKTPWLPLAYVNKVGEVMLLYRTCDDKAISTICQNIVFGDINTVPIDYEMMVKLTADYTKSMIPATKRVIYTANVIGIFATIIKYDNSARRTEPKTEICRWVLSVKDMPQSERNALFALLNSPVQFKTGAYIPSSFAGVITKGLCPKSNNKLMMNKYDINYVVQCDGMPGNFDITLVKTIGKKIITRITLGHVKNYEFLVVPEFAEVRANIERYVYTMNIPQIFTISIEDAEQFVRMFEAPKLTPTNIDSKAEKFMINEPDIFIATNDRINYWLELNETSAGREIVVAKYKGDKFVYHDWVGVIDDGSITIYDEYASAEDIIRKNLYRMGSEPRFHLSSAAGEFIWEIHENLEKESKKTTTTSKPTPVAANINSEAGNEPTVTLVAIDTIPLMATTKAIMSPLNIDAKIILI